MANLKEVEAELVRPAGDRMEREARARWILERFDERPLRDARPAKLSIDALSWRSHQVLGDREVDRPLRRCGNPRHNRGISLSDGAHFKLAGEMSVALRISRQDDEPARVAVESVHDACAGKRYGGARCEAVGLVRTNARNREKSRVLVENDDPRVFVHCAEASLYTCRFAMHRSRILAGIVLVVTGCLASCSPTATTAGSAPHARSAAADSAATTLNAEPDQAWRLAEAGNLRDPVQLTSPDRFVKAGEAYFSPDASMVVFQAIEQPAPGATADDFYAMFVADLLQDPARLANIRRISPAGSANTCGWFDASHPRRVIFGSTITPPANKEVPGYQRGTGRYKWQFPSEMRIVAVDLDAAAGSEGSTEKPITLAGDGNAYAAECTTTRDGRWLLHCTLASGQGDIVVKDLISGRAQPLVTAPGYDGGPFFSNGENRLCYRSDRHGDSLLQVHVCDVVRDTSGAITGTRNERQLTANEHVNWAPYWSPDDEVLIYASSEVGHDNYEIFEVSTAASDATPVRARITHAPGADVLPVFDPSGRRMMWTSQRGPGKSSQLWIADLVTPHPPSASGAP